MQIIAIGGTICASSLSAQDQHYTLEDLLR
jgi:hypothetical protein